LPQTAWGPRTCGSRAIGQKINFDRFGIITTHIDGNGQTVYFDDLTYTAIIPEPSTLMLAGLGLIALLAYG
jgi:hypothetical protein